MSRIPIRLRVTGAFVVVMGLVLLATGLFVDAPVRAERTRALDAELRTAVAAPADVVRADDEEIAQLLDRSGAVVASSREAGTRPLLSRAEVAGLLLGDGASGAARPSVPASRSTGSSSGRGGLSREAISAALPVDGVLLGALRQARQVNAEARTGSAGDRVARHSAGGGEGSHRHPRSGAGAGRLDL